MAIIRRGQEPANIKKRLDTLFPKLNEAYPDKVIRSLARDHKKWAETVTELYRALGYPDSESFLKAYGYTVERAAATGRPSNDHMAVIEELKKRYPNGAPFAKMGELQDANPDLANKFKTLANRSKELFGMTLADYLKSIGLLGGSDHKKQLDELLTELKRRYPEGTALPATLAELKENNADLMVHRLSYTKDVYGVNPQEYLVNAGLIKDVDPASELKTFVTTIKERYAGKLMPGSLDQLKTENGDLPFASASKWVQEIHGMSLVQFLKKEKIIDLESRQLQATEKVAANKPAADTLEFAGRAFATTGLDDQQEKKIADLVRSRGGFLRRVVSKNTDYLIKNPRIPENFVSPKYELAQALISQGVNIHIFEYREFIKLANQTPFESVSEFIIKDGVLNRYTGKGESVVIPDGVLDISKNAFDGCNHIGSLRIPGSVKHLRPNAFKSKSKLVSVVLSEGLTKITKFAFFECSSLSSINIPKSVTEIEENAFGGCCSLKTMVLPDGLEKIGFGAFQWCTSLRVLIIPESVKEIEKEAFYRCSKLFICAPAGSYAEKYAKKHKIPLIAECDIDNFPTEKKLLPLFEQNGNFNSKKGLFGSSSYSYRLRTKSKEALTACLSYIAYGAVCDSFDPKMGIDSAEAEIYEQGDEYIAEIAYKTCIFMDLPNLYDDVECMYTYCKEMIEQVGACPFKFEFSINNRHGDYFHIGDCTFDGKTISYFDNASVNCMEPYDSSAMAEYINGEFVNEEKDFDTENPD